MVNKLIIQGGRVIEEKPYKPVTEYRAFETEMRRQGIILMLMLCAAFLGIIGFVVSVVIG